MCTFMYIVLTKEQRVITITHTYFRAILIPPHTALANININ